MNITRLSGDHPRIRGEHSSFSARLLISRGSSPHTRGAPAPPVIRVAEGGIIPAYAGSTMATYRLDLMTQDHPRIRGEHSNPLEQHWGHPGSSPHTRGALKSSRNGPSRARIIPAYAGSTCAPINKAYASKDHPRIRGEHSKGYLTGVISSGSSPHTRGAPPRCPQMFVDTRIIPAYAGSTP